MVLLSISLNKSFSQDKNLQLKLGESVSIYSEKAYKRNKGNTFEAIGNVVIINRKETLYGEKASVDLANGKVSIEGNVRVISPGINIYGSSIYFEFESNHLEIKNARVITEDFNLVANSFKKTGPKTFYAKEAQFTTCTDCAESWSVFGEEIYVEIDEYVKVHHALARIKGVSILYFPYIILPIKTKRESGLLFPTFSLNSDEGVTFDQPIFLNLGDDKDLTLTPRFLSERGYGLDTQFRQVFGEKKWLELSDRAILDFIYLPEKTDHEISGEKYLRNFTYLESHLQLSNNLNVHFDGGWLKDLDMINDFALYMQNYSPDGNMGLYSHIDYRSDNFTINLEGNYRRNNAVSDPLLLDKDYVQILPSFNLSTKPFNLITSDQNFLQKIIVGADTNLTRFSQISTNSDNGIRNLTRLDARPFVDLHLFDIGAIHFKTNYVFDAQLYKLHFEDDSYFSKYANVFRTSASFTMSKIFGKAQALKRKRKSINSDKKISDLIGSLPSIKDTESLDFEIQYKNSYKHSQNFQFIHHYTSSSDEVGNSRFKTQISNSDGWFDYEDALNEDIATLGINDVRTQIPVLNTFEFQWNNTIVKKSINSSLFNKNIEQNDYLKIGYFNLSQGFILSNDSGNEEFKNKLTRLYVDMGYTLGSFNFSARDYYFHSDSNHKLDLNIEKKFKNFGVLSSYSYNSIDNSRLRTVRFGGVIRPIDALGFSFLQEFDLNTNSDIKKVYQADYMPDNNCWLINLSYTDRVDDSRFTFNFVFNFGNDTYDEYKKNYFSFDRI